MASFPNQILYGFVVDTENYAGNFECEMCAWMTGHTGECGKGNDEVNIALEELDPLIYKAITENITGYMNDGVLRPCSLYETPGWYNDGKGKYSRYEGLSRPADTWPAYLSVIIFFRTNVFSQVDLVRTLKERALSYKPPRWATPITITGFRAQRIEISTRITNLTLLG